MFIDCGVCGLRAWCAGDEASLQHHANDREIWLSLRDRFPNPYTRADSAAWIEANSDQTPPTSLAVDVGGEAVGGVSLMFNHDIERLSAEIGYWLGREFWGRGLMTAAVRAATDYAFTTFSLTRVFAVPFPRNPASLRVLEKAGYVREGLMRRSAIKDGIVLDQVMYAITDEDWKPPRGG